MCMDQLPSMKVIIICCKHELRNNNNNSNNNENEGRGSRDGGKRAGRAGE